MSALMPRYAADVTDDYTPGLRQLRHFSDTLINSHYASRWPPLRAITELCTLLMFHFYHLRHITIRDYLYFIIYYAILFTLPPPLFAADGLFCHDAMPRLR